MERGAGTLRTLPDHPVIRTFGVLEEEDDVAGILLRIRIGC
jgi:hypothetical protein